MQVLLSVIVFAYWGTLCVGGSPNGTMYIGDGKTVEAKSNSTIFLGTEYDPSKCLLQYTSIGCTEKDCAELNGFKLECTSVGMQDGQEKKKCNCRLDEAKNCSKSVPTKMAGTVPQFGDCSNGKQCVDSYGQVSTKVEERVCAEKLHCVVEVNTTATNPAHMCHTCRSCITQNDAPKLASNKRFNCTEICPQEILDSLAARNKKGLGVADNIESESSSGSTSGSSSTPPKDSSGGKSKKSSDTKHTLNGATATSIMRDGMLIIAALMAMLFN